MWDLKLRGRLGLGDRVMSAPSSPRPLINMASSLQSHLRPPVSQVALRSERCRPYSHLPVPRYCQSIRATAMETFVVSGDRRRRGLIGPRATHDSAFVLPTFASGPLLASWRNYGALTESKFGPTMPRRSHSRFTFAPPREWLRLGERSRSSQRIFLRGFTALARVPQVDD